MHKSANDHHRSAHSSQTKLKGDFCTNTMQDISYKLALVWVQMISHLCTVHCLLDHFLDYCTIINYQSTLGVESILSHVKIEGVMSCMSTSASRKLKLTPLPIVGMKLIWSSKNNKFIGHAMTHDELASLTDVYTVLQPDY